MVAYGENPRLYQNVASQAPFLRDLTTQANIAKDDSEYGPWRGTWNCVTNASHRLRLLYHDLDDELQTHWPDAHSKEKAEVADAQDLIKLGHWALVCVLRPDLDLKTNFLLLRTDKDQKSVDECTENLNKMESHLLNCQAQLAGVTVRALKELPHASWKIMSKDKEDWSEKSNQLVIGIPALGFMELLVRVIAHRSKDLDTLYNRLMQLHSREPKPRFRTPRPALDVPTLSAQLHGAFRDVQEEVEQAPDLETRARIRQNAIRRWRSQNKDNIANHHEERCIPLSCPSFEPKPRCLRCQGLFIYGMDGNLLDREKKLRGDKVKPVGRLCHQGWNCAETIAYFCCEDAASTGNH
ncbi:hypothetical protein QBC46DRAFT_345389 [Diplogelasinospora grovesii]|uniref:Uncharacterized protein n=1 Tax=Diplogelasinospora grovesii TaxID=303347 RepID=A0AAN6N024_9PEZI|nr:hypothetical protein QBC46DRAFT_345389 [Diplogelasinospora grovesii]